MNGRLLLWLDLEMTGLNPDRDLILEIATVLTDTHFNLVAKGPQYVIAYMKEDLERMEPIVRTMHTESGLIKQVLNSTTSLDEAYQQTVNFIQTYCTKGQALLCGNTIWQDRRFLERYMPEILYYTHYRLVDISTIKELIRAWYPTSPEIHFKKNTLHRAVDDIFESIAELKHYQEHFFVPLPPSKISF